MKRLWILLLIAVMALPTLAIGENTPTPDAPLDPAATLERAYEQVFSGDFTDAVATLSALIAQQPDNVEALLLRANAYEGLARMTLAVDDVTRAITVLPWAWDLHLTRGNLWAQQGDSENAMRDFNRAIDLNPRYGDGFAALSGLYYALESNELGEAYYQMSLGAFAYDAGEFTAALDQFDLVLATDVDDDTLRAYAYYNRALANFERGNERAAMQDATAATEYFQDMHDIYLLRGTLYHNEGDLERAGADYARRIQLLAKTTETLPANEDARVEMAYGSVFEVPFDATQGQSIRILAQDANRSRVDALIAVLDPSGNPVAGDDDTGGGEFALDAEVAFTAEADGTYTLLISHANGGYTGLIDVRVDVR